MHFLEIQGPGIFAAGLGEGIVVHGGQGDCVHSIVDFARNPGGLRFKARLGVPLLTALDAVTLDKRVAQQVAGQHVHLFVGEGRGLVAADAVLHGSVHAQTVARQIQHHGGGIARGAGLVVGHAGAKAHFHKPVCRGVEQGQRLERGILKNGVVPDAFVQQTRHLGRVQAVHRKDLDLADAGNRNVQRLAQVLGRLAALGIVKSGAGAGFHPIEHGLHSSWFGCLLFSVAHVVGHLAHKLALGPVRQSF